MRLSDIARKIKPSFEKVRRDGYASKSSVVAMELKDVETFPTTNSTLQDRLIDSDISSEEDFHLSAQVSSGSTDITHNRSYREMKDSFPNSISNGNGLGGMHNNIYLPTTTTLQEHDHMNQEEELLDLQDGNVSRYRNNRGSGCRVGGVLFYLILTIIAIFVTIFITVVTVFIMDGYATGKDHNTTISSQRSREMSELPLEWPVKDVNEESEKPKVLEYLIFNDSLKHEENSVGNGEQHTKPQSTFQPVKISKIPVPENYIRESYMNASNALKERKQSQGELNETSIWTLNKTLGVLRADEKIKLITQQGQVMEEAYQSIVQRLNLTKEQAEQGEIILENATLPSELCPKLEQKIPCNFSEPYRSLDGTCNHFNKPYWGSTNQPYRRMLFPNYENGISSPRSKSVNGNPLPSARAVSETVHIDEFRSDQVLSKMLPVWANFIFHDIVHTATIPDFNCCKNGKMELNSLKDDNCFPIIVPSNDTYYTDQNVFCLDFERGAPYGSCYFGPREQFNKATAYIDASHIYGVHPELTNSLRLLNDPKKLGQLKLSGVEEALYLLPLSNDSNPASLFVGGDDRVNEVSMLSALHTVWVRQHNALAEKLSELNGHWDDEKVFQEARRILIAQVQHITYNEFLPLIFPKELRKSTNLSLLKEGYFEAFDSRENPGISNGFTIAFQFFQSMIPGLQKKLNAHRTDEEYEQFHKTLYNPGELQKEGEVDRLLLGSSSQHAEIVDAFISGQITHMYRKHNKTGLDLIAMVLQAGRDQGLPPYLEWRKKCGLSEVNSFEQLSKIWFEDAVGRVQKVYEHVHDVDMLSGILSERHSPKSRLGPTLSCILVDQFIRLKQGDMFWYEGDIRTDHFTPEQLRVIRKTTLAKIICENALHIHAIQKNVMALPSKDNRVVHCFEISKIKLHAWKEKGKGGGTAPIRHQDDHYDDDSYESSSYDDYYDESEEKEKIPPINSGKAMVKPKMLNIVTVPPKLATTTSPRNKKTLEIVTIRTSKTAVSKRPNGIEDVR